MAGLSMSPTKFDSRFRKDSIPHVRWWLNCRVPRGNSEDTLDHLLPSTPLCDSEWIAEPDAQTPSDAGAYHGGSRKRRSCGERLESTGTGRLTCCRMDTQSDWPAWSLHERNWPCKSTPLYYDYKSTLWTPPPGVPYGTGRTILWSITPTLRGMISTTPKPDTRPVVTGEFAIQFATLLWPLRSCS